MENSVPKCRTFINNCIGYRDHRVRLGAGNDGGVDDDDGVRDYP